MASSLRTLAISLYATTCSFTHTHTDRQTNRDTERSTHDADGGAVRRRPSDSALFSVAPVNQRHVTLDLVHLSAEITRSRLLSRTDGSFKHRSLSLARACLMSVMPWLIDDHCIVVVAVETARHSSRTKRTSEHRYKQISHRFHQPICHVSCWHHSRLYWVYIRVRCLTDTDRRNITAICYHRLVYSSHWLRAHRIDFPML